MTMLRLKTVLMAGACFAVLTGVAGCNTDTAETNALIAEQTRAIKEQTELQRHLVAFKVAEDAAREDSGRKAREWGCQVRTGRSCRN